MNVVVNIPFRGCREYLDNFDETTIPDVGDRFDNNYIVKEKIVQDNVCTLDLIRSVYVLESQKEYIKMIKIKGYKSIQDQEISLNQVNVMIGANGSGKSCFISMFDFLDTVFKKQLGEYSYKHGVEALLHNGKDGANKISAELSFNNGISYGFDLIPTNDGRLIFSREFYSIGDVRTDITNEIHRESVWEQCGNEDICRTLQKCSWRTYNFADAKSKLMEVCDVADNAFLWPDAGNLAAFLYRLKTEFPDNYIQIVDYVRLIAPYFEDFVLHRQGNDRNQIRLCWAERGQKRVHNASDFSDGTLRFICLAALLQPAELQPAVIVMDNPGSSLHPMVLYIFSEMIRQASLKSQILLSAQSAVLLDCFDPEDVLVVSREGRGTEFARLDEEEIRDWLKDYSLGDLWRKNIFGGNFAR